MISVNNNSLLSQTNLENYFWETPCWKKIDFIPAWSYTILQIKSNLDFISA